MHRHTEQEWQFAASELETARTWLAAQPHEATERRFAARPTLDLRDTYYDSADWMIFRSGYALRIRHARGDQAGDSTEVTLKSLRPSLNGFAQRTEFSESVGSASLEQVLARPGIGARIRELVGTRPLNALFQAHTRRERQHLLEADTDLPLAEVDLDETSIDTGDGGTHEMKRVEVECINAEPGALTPMVEQLRDAAQLQPVEVSKFRAGLAAVGLEPDLTVEAAEVPLQATQPFAAAQLALLRRYFLAVLSQEAAVRSGAANAVHEMRVAARHLEVLLRMFRGYGPAWAVASRGRVHGLVKALGIVRDCDVQLAYLDAALANCGPQDRQAFEPIHARLAAHQASARERLSRVLDSPPVRQWQRDWEGHLRAGTPGSKRAQAARTAVVARQLIRDAARSLRKRARRIDDASLTEDFHEVRIRAKRLRYILDAFAELYGEPAGQYLEALARLQAVLGDYHDATLREQRFAALIAAAPRLPSSTSFLAGRLVERDARAFEECRRQFPKAWRRLRKRRWRELSAAMKALAEPI